MNHDSEPGVTISLPIPAVDAGLFKNKSTDDVLLFLSRHRFDEFTVTELADSIDQTKSTVNRAVDDLEANGLVLSDHHGPRRFVRINRERLSVPDDPVMRIPQPEFHEPVRAAVEELRRRVDDLLAVVLYGSVARGRADRLSDVDLWVLVRNDRAEHKRTANEIERDLEQRTFRDGNRYAFHVDVEAVKSLPTYTADVREIVASGIPIHGTEDFETVRNLLFEEVDGDE